MFAHTANFLAVLWKFPFSASTLLLGESDEDMDKYSFGASIWTREKSNFKLARAWVTSWLEDVSDPIILP